jgi:cytochrome c-type biogenesis protein CcmH/NrfG
VRRGHRAPGRAVPALALLGLLAGVAHADRARARALHLDAVPLITGEPARALALLEQSIAADADYLPAHDAAIPLWIGAGQIARMVVHLERATARHPGYAAGWYALGFAYRQQGRDAIAVLAYQSYLALRPGDAAAWFGYAMALDAVGRPEPARAALSRYLDLERDPANAAFVIEARRRLERVDRRAARWHLPGAVCLRPRAL